jgi:hypothetical protein
LLALRGLHSLGWVHRDVRAENVLFDPVREEFFLMDLEWAERTDRKMGDYRPKLKRVPPELKENGAFALDARWGVAADVWQVRGLLRPWCPGLNEGWARLHLALRDPDPARRPSVEQALAALDETERELL